MKKPFNAYIIKSTPLEEVQYFAWCGKHAEELGKVLSWDNTRWVDGEGMQPFQQDLVDDRAVYLVSTWNFLGNQFLVTFDRHSSLR